MARTHKERHAWKTKERKRTGQSNPDKIALHRKRFLEMLEQQSMVRNCYRPIVFQSRLTFLEEGLTELSMYGNKIEDIPFLVDDPASCHYVVTAHIHNFNESYETDILSQHVQRVKYLGQDCHLMVQAGETRVCSSIIACRYRRWLEDSGRPGCTLR